MRGEGGGGGGGGGREEGGGRRGEGGGGREEVKTKSQHELLWKMNTNRQVLYRYR